MKELLIRFLVQVAFALYFVYALFIHPKRKRKAKFSPYNSDKVIE